MPDITNLPNARDPGHKYVFRSGEYAPYFQYFWQDKAKNYVQYTNADESSPDYDPYAGEPLIVATQPFPHTAPEFYTAEGYRRSQALPEGVTTLLNQKYNPKKLPNSWYEYYVADSGDLRYVYLDKDVKENIELYVQQQIRVLDSGLVRFRKFAAQMFSSTIARDKTLGCLLFLCDQAYYSPEQLIQATAGDIDFIDETVYLLGRKFRCDVNILDYLTSLIQGKDLEAPLFSQDTLHGSQLPFGPMTIASIFAYLRVSQVFLPYWHATHIFSKIVNKLHLFKVPAEDVKARAFIELANALGTTDDVTCLVDFQVVDSLMAAYGQEESITKSLNISAADDFGVASVFSDLIERRGDELAFSQWLHNTPLHSDAGDEGEDEQELLEDAQREGAVQTSPETDEEEASPLDNDSEESMPEGGSSGEGVV